MANGYFEIFRSEVRSGEVLDVQVPPRTSLRRFVPAYFERALLYELAVHLLNGSGGRLSSLELNVAIALGFVRRGEGCLGRDDLAELGEGLIELFVAPVQWLEAANEDVGREVFAVKLRPTLHSAQCGVVRGDSAWAAPDGWVPELICCFQSYSEVSDPYCAYPELWWRK